MKTHTRISEIIAPFAGHAVRVKQGIYHVKTACPEESIYLMNESLRNAGFIPLTYQTSDRNMPVVGVFLP